MRSFQKAFLCLAVLALAGWLRAYTLGLHLPFFYEEDEAHHFNRTVNMVKTGDYNPHYFNKPSLHFYLRMPAVRAGIERVKSRTGEKFFEEVRTHDKFGLADFAFTASHPTVVKAARLVSVVIGILLAVVTFAVALRLSLSPGAAFAAAALTAVSPDLVRYSGIVGVDIVMSLFCWVSIYFALRHVKSAALADLALCAIAAGFAVSSKYNALPIVAVPFFAALFQTPVRTWRVAAASILSAAAFFAGSPYILIDFSKFMENLQYEIWHYGTAGHVGNMAEPGFPQAAFYLTWLFEHAVGALAAAAAAIGLIRLAFEPRRRTFLFVIFPLLYFLEMSLQKANFIRNMLVFIPFTAILAAYAGDRLLLIVGRPAMRIAAAALFFFVLLIEPLSVSLIDRMVLMNRKDTRLALQEWVLKQEAKPPTAISGHLLLPYEVRRLSNMTTIDDEALTPAALYMQGFDRLVSGTRLRASLPVYMREIWSVPGHEEKQRIVKNPAVVVYEFMPGEPLYRDLEAQADILNFKSTASPREYTCADMRGGEDYCWQQKRLAKIALSDPAAALEGTPDGDVTVTLELFNTWPYQRIRRWAASTPGDLVQENAPPGEWQTVNMSVPKQQIIDGGGFMLFAERLETPLKQGLGKDERRLAFAIRSVKIH